MKTLLVVMIKYSVVAVEAVMMVKVEAVMMVKVEAVPMVKAVVMTRTLGPSYRPPCSRTVVMMEVVMVIMEAVMVAKAGMMIKLGLV
jgi:hypothetical protein